MKGTIYLRLIVFVVGLMVWSCGNDDVPKTIVPEEENNVPEEENKAPTIMNISPSEGAVGSEITISGENFGSVVDDITVSFNGVFANNIVLDENGNLIVTVPEEAMDGEVVVTVNEQTSEAVNFNLLPSIIDFQPKETKEGDQIMISGTGFGDDTNLIEVVFGGNVEADDTTINDNGDIVAIVPSGAQTGAITLTIGEENTKSEEVLNIYRVYVAGYVMKGGKSIATLWTNGVEEQLSENESRAYSVFVDGTDVYAAGFVEKDNMELIATIWKNGEVYMELTDGLFEAAVLSVYVANGNVYAAGGQFNNDFNGYVPKIWKNSEEALIGEVNPGIARSVFVDGNDFYVCGDERVDGNEEVLYWKNGERHILESFPSDINKNYSASSIYVKDGLIYTVGAIGNFVANAWTSDTDGSNITSTKLVENEELYSRASSVFLEGNDVYIAGRYDKKAVIWKNGVLMEIPSSQVEISSASSVFIYDGDIYVAGGEGENAVLWVNYSQIFLPTTGDSSSARSVFVF